MALSPLQALNICKAIKDRFSELIAYDGVDGVVTLWTSDYGEGLSIDKDDIEAIEWMLSQLSRPGDFTL